MVSFCSSYDRLSNDTLLGSARLSKFAMPTIDAFFSFPKKAPKWPKKGQLRQVISRSSLNHSRSIWCRFVVHMTGFLTTPYLVPPGFPSSQCLPSTHFPPKMAPKWPKRGPFLEGRCQLRQVISRSTLNHSRSVWCRFVVHMTVFLMTPYLVPPDFPSSQCLPSTHFFPPKNAPKKA